MPSTNRLVRPAAALLSTTTKRVQPCTYGRLYEISRQAHTSSRSLGITLQPRPVAPTTTRLPTIAPRGARSIFIQTEVTPNADALKFLPNHNVIPPEVSTPFIEYLNPRSTIAPPYPSPLAAELMNIDGVTSVFYGPDFITVTKSPDANWIHIRPEVFSLITEAITSGQEIVTVTKKEGAEDGQEATDEDTLSYNENDSEVVGMIKELLETRIRPAIQEDGGDIEFRGFDDGYVKLKLRGACRTCDSSTVTLKNGIEGMLMHYIEEVKGVHQIMDQEEEIAMQEFAKFEEKLRAQKGPDAVPPTTPGKDSLDSVPG
ncbi:HIRA-interacting protein 5 [Hypoxylon trugodes]|uniref:HIRA-interacting protein 5 n=1 Tax=Hypoxylon trugodes TaxID=326681 RepID=UPI0021982DC5|nr:HIRA-interacting protein 5 [Hypoxylon trugodes]KAI1388292.1 HIRA-interacting protein 5 [Hypoxylon trugodes]